MDTIKNKFHYLYLIIISLIMTLPLLNLPPWFSPPDFGKTIIFRILLAIFLFLFISETLIKKELRIKTSKTLWMLLALLGITFLATLFSENIFFSLFGSPYRAGGFINFASYIIFGILTFLTLKRKEWFKFLNVSLFIGVLVSLVAIFQNFHILPKIFVSVTDQPWSTIGGSTFLAMYLLVLFFISFVLAIKSLKEKTKKWIPYSLVSLLFVYIVFLTLSRAAFIGLALGLIYFVFAYSSDSKRLKRLKTALIVLILIGIVGIIWINISPPDNNLKRLTFKRALEDPRFSVWRISSRATLSKPLFGYGPENFSIAFDSHYDPNLPRIKMGSGSNVPTSWYDRAHSIIFETGATTGIPALLIYLGLFVALFIELSKRKGNNYLIIHGLQSIFIAYLVANFFGFDVMPTYLLFFFLMGFSMHLIASKEKVIKIKTGLFAYPIIALLFVGLIAFIWIYNLKPLQVNAEINKAKILSLQRNYPKSIEKFEEIIEKDSIVKEYAIANYIEVLNVYIYQNPRKTINATPRGIELLKEALEIRPKYTRYWLLLGTYYNLLLENYSEIYPEFVEEWKNGAESAFDKAEELSPNRQETVLRWAKTNIFVGNYDKAEELINRCIEINSDLGDCYWTKALSRFKQNKAEEALEAVELAEKAGYPVYTDEGTMLELRKMYSYLKDSSKYILNLCKVYYGLLNKNLDNPDYSVRALACYIKEGKTEEAEKLAKYLRTYHPQVKETVNNLMNQIQ